jgi:uncharacterized protein (DUF58 family)
MTAPSWWYSLSGAFFALALLGAFFAFILLTVLTFAALEAWLFFRRQRTKVEAAIEKVKLIADKADSVTDDAAVRAKGLLTQVDDAAAGGMQAVEKIAPALAALGMVFGAARLARPKRQAAGRRGKRKIKG